MGYGLRMSPIRSRRQISRRIACVGGGAVLVAAFAAWLVLRQTDAIQPVVAMDTALGWMAQIGAYLILMAGVALLARGVFGRSEKGPSG